MPDPYPGPVAASRSATLGTALEREVDLLDRRIRSWTGRSWTVLVRTGVTRADLLASLARYLDELGRGAGVPVPAEAPLPRVANHALADQVVVLAGELAAAIQDGRLALGDPSGSPWRGEPPPGGSGPRSGPPDLAVFAERGAAAVRDTRLALER
ncbi:MAG: hypothetical protein ACQSGP_07185 [Frankia sp.]